MSVLYSSFLLLIQSVSSESEYWPNSFCRPVVCITVLHFLALTTFVEIVIINLIKACSIFPISVTGSSEQYSVDGHAADGRNSESAGVTQRNEHEGVI